MSEAALESSHKQLTSETLREPSHPYRPLSWEGPEPAFRAHLGGVSKDVASNREIGHVLSWLILRGPGMAGTCSRTNTGTLQ